MRGTIVWDREKVFRNLCCAVHHQVKRQADGSDEPVRVPSSLDGNWV